MFCSQKQTSMQESEPLRACALRRTPGSYIFIFYLGLFPPRSTPLSLAMLTNLHSSFPLSASSGGIAGATTALSSSLSSGTLEFALQVAGLRRAEES